MRLSLLRAVQRPVIAIAADTARPPQLSCEFRRRVLQKMADDACPVAAEIYLEPAIDARNRNLSVAGHGHAAWVVHKGTRRSIEIGVERGRVPGRGFQIRAARRGAVDGIMNARVFEGGAQNGVLDVIQRQIPALDRNELGSPRPDIGFPVEETCAGALDVAYRFHRVGVQNHLERQRVIEVCPECEGFVSGQDGRMPRSKRSNDGSELVPVRLRSVPFGVSGACDPVRSHGNVFGEQLAVRPDGLRPACVPGGGHR